MVGYSVTSNTTSKLRSRKYVKTEREGEGGEVLPRIDGRET